MTSSTQRNKKREKAKQKYSHLQQKKQNSIKSKKGSKIQKKHCEQVIVIKHKN